MRKYTCMLLRLFTVTLLIISCGSFREKSNQNVQVKIDTVGDPILHFKFYRRFS